MGLAPPRWCSVKHRTGGHGCPVLAELAGAMVELRAVEALTGLLGVATEDD